MPRAVKKTPSSKKASNSSKLSKSTPKKKSKTPEKVRFGYRVRFHQYDEVAVEKLQIFDVTENTVRYANSHAVEFTDEKKGPAHRWFPKREKADRFALTIINHRIAQYEALLNRLRQQERDIVDTINSN